MLHPQFNARPDFDPALALSSAFEFSLHRALLPLTEGADGSPPGGRMQDVGMGVVLDGSDPVRAEVIELGSAERRIVDLDRPFVVLGWLYPSGLRHLDRLVSKSDPEGRDRARTATFDLALRALRVAGFGPLTRPSVLRIGFRDVCRDLDLHESTAVRMVLPSSGVVRLHLDYERVSLVTRTGRSAPSSELEAALGEAFPRRGLFRGPIRDAVGAQAYHMPLPVPRTFGETRKLLRELRGGLLQLLGRFEPDRLRALRELTGTFGERNSLHNLQEMQDSSALEPVHLSPRPPEVVGRGAGTVH